MKCCGRILKLYFLPISMGLTGIQCQQKKLDLSYQTLDTLPFENGDIEPKIGDGYDSLVQKLRNTPSCVTGSITTLTSTSKSISFDQNIAVQHMTREFTGEVQGTPRMFFLPFGVSTGFFRSINKKSSTLSVIYGVKIQTGGEKLSGVSLADSSKILGSNDLFKQCGDSYVTQINRGGLLAVTLNMDFSTDQKRNKWQGKLKLNGGLGEISTDLLNNIQRDGIDGSLTIYVNQVGGLPQQSLIPVKTCSMGSIEEFNLCKQHLDDLMNYAVGQFPSDIAQQPAILNYLTQPLQSLGVQNLPTLDQEVLKKRFELEQLQKSNYLHSDMIDKAKNAGLAFDTSLAGDIEINKNLIVRAANSCFSYDWTQNGIDWTSCKIGYQTLKEQLKRIPTGNLAVHELNVPSYQEIGQSIVNEYSSKMSIVFSVSAQKSWNHGKNIILGNSQLLSPQDKLGALLMRTDGSYHAVGQSGQADIYPGESLGFVMNDVLGNYADNQGSQTIYWRCTNCNPEVAKVPTYRLVIKAGTEAGTVFRSRESTSNNYRYFAYGRWGSSSRSQLSEIGQSGESCSDRCPLPQSPKQSLIVSTELGSKKALSRDGCLVVKPNSSVIFMMNDEKGKYGDNRGEIEIILQAQKCGLNSHPIIVDQEN
jgi:hypothetical protein